ncbi:MAG: GNAT family N-acetyltransferase [Gammaproteobacteria bacterium]|nr:GNAT family N-acetyltransferase [Gammaproteobacteria bacterium]
MKYIIQIANQADAYDIASINAVAWKHAYADILPKEILDSISIDKWAESWNAALGQEPIVLKIHSNNRIIGFSQMCKDHHKLQETFGEISSLYLHPDVWRKGFGSQLCLASLMLLKDLGFDQATIWVLAANERARNFYQSLGFEKSGMSRICNLFSMIELDEVQYTKKL